jgi:peptide deformylase
MVLINPKITKTENEIEVEESCLSLKNITFKKKRFDKIRVEYKDVHGKRHTSTFIGTNAHCVQHEIDHLNGILINM